MKLTQMIPIALACVLTQRAESQDVELTAFLSKWSIPGGAVAMVRGGKLHSRGIGLANPAAGESVKRDSRFRVASITKPITATAILKLVEDRRIRLDDRVFDWLPRYRSHIADVRAHAITIRQLLQHSGGWDAALSSDPLYASREELEQAGLDVPPQQEQVIAFWLGQPLDFTPGTRFAYSNFGYVLLGRVIEVVTSTPYEEWVAKNILEPSGFEHPQLAGSLASERVRGEASYSDQPDAPLTMSVVSREPDLVPAPYGSFSLALQDSAGGWLASAPELARFLSRLAAGKIVRPETVAVMLERPSYLPAGAQAWYGLGVYIYTSPAGAAIIHDGSFAGTSALIMHVPGLATVAALFNSKPRDYGEFVGELQQILLEAAIRLN